MQFMEGMQKLFVIGGASKENQQFAMLQLQQSLASGRLQGDEFRSITENAPILQDMIAKTMKVSRGELKQLSAQGKSPQIPSSGLYLKIWMKLMINLRVCQNVGVITLQILKM